tara:strand:- start:4949 stop:5518 length:570 start_codon:yes stop_codon:yes gene_type:complete
MALTTTETSISNSALVKLGAERINSLTETNRRAQLCNEQYEKVRDEVLRAHPWNFAIKRMELSQLTTTPAFEYDYEYLLPSDCLRVLELHDNTIKWSIEADRKLLSDSATVKIKYISRVTATAEYDSLFIEALSFRLAADISYALVQSSSLSQKLLGEYENVLSAARSIDAQEGTAPDLIDDSFVESRL